MFLSVGLFGGRLIFLGDLFGDLDWDFVGNEAEEVGILVVFERRKMARVGV